MEKDIGKIKKNETIDIVIRIDDFGGKRGLTIREYMTGDRYTGFTKAGTRIPAESFEEFRKLINSIELDDLKAKEEKETEKAEEEKVTEETKPKRGHKKKEKVEEKEEAKEESEEQETLEEDEE